MDKRQKSFMKIASIGGIIESGILIFVACIMFILSANVSDATIVSILKEFKFINVAGMYNLSDSTGFSLTLSGQNISYIASSTRSWFFDNALSLLGIAALNLAISIVVLVHAKKEIYKKWAIIVGLIACIPAGNWVCLAFYIVVLCLASKQKEEIQVSNVE